MRTLTPSTETVSRSSVPARMRMPSARAAQDEKQAATTATPTITTMNTR